MNFLTKATAGLMRGVAGLALAAAALTAGAADGVAQLRAFVDGARHAVGLKLGLAVHAFALQRVCSKRQPMQHHAEQRK